LPVDSFMEMRNHAGLIAFSVPVATILESSYRSALTALQDVAAGFVAGGTLPTTVRADTV